MLILPAVICVFTNTLIYRHVRSSSNRAQSPDATNASNRRHVSRRDIFLLRHMVIMFAVFVLGWAPWMTGYVVGYYVRVATLVTFLMNIWFQLALMFEMIDLFLYNHEVRKYLTGLLLLPCCRR